MGGVRARPLPMALRMDSSVFVQGIVTALPPPSIPFYRVTVWPPSLDILFQNSLRSDVEIKEEGSEPPNPPGGQSV